MGTILALTRPAAALATALALAACAPPAPGAGGGLSDLVPGLGAIAGPFGRVMAGVGSGRDDAAPAPRAALDFTPNAIAAAPGEFLLMQVNALGLQEPSRVVRRNGPEVTYALQSGPTAAFDDGILVATRGFGDDLMAIDSQAVRAALAAGGGAYARRLETLTAQDAAVVSDFACTLRPAGSEVVDLGLRQVSLSRFDESCRNESLVFDNIYWLDASGRILSSRQFVSPGAAYLRSNVL